MEHCIKYNNTPLFAFSLYPDQSRLSVNKTLQNQNENSFKKSAVEMFLCGDIADEHFKIIFIYCDIFNLRFVILIKVEISWCEQLILVAHN